MPDCVQVVIDAGQDWIHDLDDPVPREDVLDHIFSCEIDHPLQDWILSAHGPKVLVPDMDEMDKVLVFDVRSKASVVRPKASNIFCGWVCHTVFSGRKYLWEIFVKGLVCGGWTMEFIIVRISKF